MSTFADDDQDVLNWIIANEPLVGANSSTGGRGTDAAGDGQIFYGQGSTSSLQAFDGAQTAGASGSYSSNSGMPAGHNVNKRQRIDGGGLYPGVPAHSYSSGIDNSNESWQEDAGYGNTSGYTYNNYEYNSNAQYTEKPPVRKRKKGHTDDTKRLNEIASLEARSRQLQAENDALLSRLHAMYPGLADDLKHRERFVDDIATLLKSREGVKRKSQEYFTKYGTTQNKWDDVERSLKELDESLQPDTTLKLLLWMLMQEDNFYSRSKGSANSSIWGMICDVMEMSPAQEEQFKQLRHSARTLAGELRLVDLALSGAKGLVKKHGKSMENEKSKLLEVLTPAQLSKLIVFIEKSNRLPLIFTQLLQGVGGVRPHSTLPEIPAPVISDEGAWPSERMR